MNLAIPTNWAAFARRFPELISSRLDVDVELPPAAPHGPDPFAAPELLDIYSGQARVMTNHDYRRIRDRTKELARFLYAKVGEIAQGRGLSPVLLRAVSGQAVANEYLAANGYRSLTDSYRAGPLASALQDHLRVALARDRSEVQAAFRIEVPQADDQAWRKRNWSPIASAVQAQFPDPTTRVELTFDKPGSWSSYTAKMVVTSRFGREAFQAIHEKKGEAVKELVARLQPRLWHIAATQALYEGRPLTDVVTYLVSHGGRRTAGFPSEAKVAPDFVDPHPASRERERFVRDARDIYRRYNARQLAHDQARLDTNIGTYMRFARLVTQAARDARKDTMPKFLKDMRGNHGFTIEPTTSQYYKAYTVKHPDFPGIYSRFNLGRSDGANVGILAERIARHFGNLPAASVLREKAMQGHHWSSLEHHTGIGMPTRGDTLLLPRPSFPWMGYDDAIQYYLDKMKEAP